MSEPRPANVTDKQAEVGIKLNNVLTALVLMVMSWVGFNIEKLKDIAVLLQVNVATNQLNIENLKHALDDHKKLGHVQKENSYGEID